MDLADVRAGFLASGVPQMLVDEMLDSYAEAKRRYHLGDHRPGEVEGGRFSEAVFRVLQHETSGAFTPIGSTLPSVDNLLTTLAQVPRANAADSVRIHIPRTLRVVYDIRNKRDAAHLADGIDANLQDSTLIVACLDWVVAELVRLHHNVSAAEAEAIVRTVVVREVPAVEEINGHPVILSTIQPREQALLLIYRAGAEGITLDDLAADLRVSRKDHLRTRVTALDRDRLVLIHPRTGVIHITQAGSREVEGSGIAQPAP